MNPLINNHFLISRRPKNGKKESKEKSGKEKTSEEEKINT